MKNAEGPDKATPPKPPQSHHQAKAESRKAGQSRPKLPRKPSQSLGAETACLLGALAIMTMVEGQRGPLLPARLYCMLLPL
jgi:hypothetical protein